MARSRLVRISGHAFLTCRKRIRHGEEVRTCFRREWGGSDGPQEEETRRKHQGQDDSGAAWNRLRVIHSSTTFSTILLRTGEAVSVRFTRIHRRQAIMRTKPGDRYALRLGEFTARHEHVERRPYIHKRKRPRDRV